MTGAEATALRAALGLSADQLAAELGLTPAVVDAWERDVMPVPRYERDWLVYHVARRDQAAALAESGLAECGWLEGWEAADLARTTAPSSDHLASLTLHLESCPTCDARLKFVESRFGSPPAVPVRDGQRVFRTVMERIARLPAWAHNPIFFAAAFLAFTLIKGLLSIPRMRANPESIPTFLLAIPFTLAMGAGVGFAMNGWQRFRSHRRAK
jgi:transcriptional regulator with XRE-family HTH domain